MAPARNENSDTCSLAAPRAADILNHHNCSKQGFQNDVANYGYTMTTGANEGGVSASSRSECAFNACFEHQFAPQ